MLIKREYVRLSNEYVCVCVCGGLGGGRRLIRISGSLTWSKTLMKVIFTPVVNFGDVRRAQLAKSTLLTSTLCPWDLFRSFKVCSDVKERVGWGKQREITAAIQKLVKLESWFLCLRWKTCLRQNCSLGSCACSDGLALGQNTDNMIYIYI